MKRYTVTFANGYRQETSSPHEAWNFQRLDGSAYTLAGKQVTEAEFFVAAQAGCEAWLAKKEQTHRRVSGLHGTSVASYVTKWVRK